MGIYSIKINLLWLNDPINVLTSNGKCGKFVNMLI